MSQITRTGFALMSALLFANISGTYAAQPKQNTSGALTGTLQKMIVENGSVTLNLDLNGLNGSNDLTTRPVTLQFATATNSNKETTATGTITVAIKNLANETVGEASLPEEIFGVPFRRHLVWEVVKGIRAREHRGTHKVKVRSEVSGSGKKPFKQKHTGRARQGGGRPPIHRHGGTVHGPTPNSYDLKVNVGAKMDALKCVLSEKIRENQFVLIENLELGTHKTKDLAAIAAKLGLEGKALFVDRMSNENLTRAARNNPRLEVVDALGIDAYNALDAKTVIVTEHALRVVTEVLG